MYDGSMKEKRGFTLIELLVSISIIAVLTALLTANFIGARQRARDGQRKANVNQIQTALELYRTDNGSYPNPSMAPSPGCGTDVSLSSGTGTIYMKSIPCDPSTGSNYIYTSTDGTSYTLYACLENEQDPDKSTDPADSGVCTTSPDVPFKVTNP